MEEQAKLLKKVRRKQAQHAAREPEMRVTFIEPDSLATVSTGPSTADQTYHLFIGNGGTQNGISRELLWTLLGSIDALYMPESKDFSFASVSGDKSALDILKRCNGLCVQDSCKERGVSHLLNPALMKGPPLHLYLSLVDQIPPILLEERKTLAEVASNIHPPPGLILVPEFVSQTEEIELLQYFSSSGVQPVPCSSLSETGAALHSSLIETESTLGGVDLTVSDTDDCESSKHDLCNSGCSLSHDTPDCSQKTIEHTLSNVQCYNQTSTVVKEDSVPSLFPSTECSQPSPLPLPPQAKPPTPSPSLPPVEAVLKHRRVKHFGYEFLYGSNRVNPDLPLPGGLPDVCLPLLRRMVEKDLLPWIPDQLTVNEYLPGAGESQVGERGCISPPFLLFFVVWLTYTSQSSIMTIC